jgi:SMC interacting uncharacterized protein involved in chromosome segregation
MKKKLLVISCIIFSLAACYGVYRYIRLVSGYDDVVKENERLEENIKEIEKKARAEILKIESTVKEKIVEVVKIEEKIVKVKEERKTIKPQKQLIESYKKEMVLKDSLILDLKVIISKKDEQIKIMYRAHERLREDWDKYKINVKKLVFKKPGLFIVSAGLVATKSFSDNQLHFGVGVCLGIRILKF